MPRGVQRPRPGQDIGENGCLRLIEALAGADPFPDTSLVCQDRNELLALLAEISKGERSEFLPLVTQVARQHGIPPQEIAARAGFNLACLEELGSDDYYKLLGVPSTATLQEIREAWIGRMSIYHPDRHPEKGEWFTRHAARLNQAYQALKDPSRRQAYDERRQRETLEQEPREPSALRHVPRQPKMPSLLANRMRRRLPAVITAGSVMVAGLVVLYLYLTRPSHQLEARLFPPSNAPGPTEQALARGRPSPDEQRDVQSPRQQPARPNEKRSPLSETAALFAPRDIQQISDSDSSAQHRMFVQALPPVTPEPKGLERQEIDTLLDEYIDAYEKGDSERLMATLSPKVREKGTLDYQAIRSQYAKGFAGRDQIIYRIKNVQVQIKGDSATVTAQYLVSARNAAQSQKGVTVSGQIEWKILREGDKPKIVAINY